MENKASDRIIIGESTHAGLPISAPARPNAVSIRGGESRKIRWLKDGNCFRLIVFEEGEWVEVPCLTGA